MCAVAELSRVGWESFEKQGEELSAAPSPPAPHPRGERGESAPAEQAATRAESAATEGGPSTPATSERDRAIYEAVCLDGRRAEEVAAELGLAATTVRNVAAATQRNLARRQFELERTASRETLVLLVERLERQWSDAREAWRESKRERTTVTTRHRDEGELIDTKRVSQCGDVRYLAEARRTLKDLTAARMQLDAWDRAADWEAASAAREAQNQAEKEAFLRKFQGGPAAVAKVVSDAPQAAARQPVAAGHPAAPSRPSEAPIDPAWRAEFKRQMIEGLGAAYDPADDALIEEAIDLTLADTRRAGPPAKAA